MTTAKKTTTRAKPARKSKPVRGSARKPVPRKAAAPARARPVAAKKRAPVKRTKIKRNPDAAKRYFVVVGEDRGFKTSSDAVAYAQRFANKYKVGLAVVEK